MHTRAIALLAAAVLAACPSSRRPGDGRDGCDHPCGAVCCGEGEICVEGACVACEPATCEGLGLFCGPLEDGCGRTLDCGSCPEGQTCGGGGQQGRCGKTGCSSESDAELCARAGRDCGALDATDKCGTARHVGSCGTCTPPATCAGSGRAGVCGEPGTTCTPETDRRFCQRHGRDCGPLADFDNCDGSRSVQTCGTCTAPKTCGGGGGSDGTCGCTGETNQQLCTAANAECGQVSRTDRCGLSRTVSCGTCTAPAACGGAGAPSRCGCTAETDRELCSAANAECGSVARTDRCGRPRTVSCGTCTAPKTCNGGGQQNRCGCTGETDAQLCQAANAQCGSVARTDRCGVSGTVPSCGTCTAPQTCGGAGTQNRCGCTDARTDAQLCAAEGFDCGAATITDRCNVPRSVPGCGTCRAPESCGEKWDEPNVCNCVGDSDRSLCSDAGADCGGIRTTDHCGAARTVASCGTCDAPLTCAGGGVQNRCGCTDGRTDAQICTARGYDCGSGFSVTDACGRSRTLSTCGTCGAGETCASNHRCSRWVDMASGYSSDFRVIHGVSDTELYIVTDNEEDVARLLKWTGTASPRPYYSAQLASSGLTVGSAYDVWSHRSSSTTTVYVAAGGRAGTARKGLVYRVANPASSNGFAVGAPIQVFDGPVWGLSGSSSATVFTGSPGLYSATPPVAPAARRLSSGSWETRVPPNAAADEMLHDVVALSASEAFFTSNSGDYLWHWNGPAFDAIPTLAAHGGYFEVWADSATDVWMSSLDGKVAQWNGTTMVDRSIPNTTSWLYGLHGTGPDDVWVVGTGPFIAHWNGTAWTVESSPASSWLNGVWVGTNYVFAVGSDGTLLRRPRR